MKAIFWLISAFCAIGITIFFGCTALPNIVYFDYLGNGNGAITILTIFVIFIIFSVVSIIVISLPTSGIKSKVYVIITVLMLVVVPFRGQEVVKDIDFNPTSCVSVTLTHLI